MRSLLHQCNKDFKGGTHGVNVGLSVGDSVGESVGLSLLLLSLYIFGCKQRKAIGLGELVVFQERYQTIAMYNCSSTYGLMVGDNVLKNTREMQSEKSAKMAK